MKFQALASIAVLLCTSAATAVPNQQWDDSCYKCEYKYDDCGKEYGGSYNSCYESFDDCYPKPWCPPKEDGCHKCEYKHDNCGKKYGGYYDSCHGDFDKWWKKPKCKKDDKCDECEGEGKGKGKGKDD